MKIVPIQKTVMWYETSHRLTKLNITITIPRCSNVPVKCSCHLVILQGHQMQGLRTTLLFRCVPLAAGQ